MGREKLYIKGIEISKADDLRSTQEYVDKLVPIYWNEAYNDESSYEFWTNIVNDFTNTGQLPNIFRKKNSYIYKLTNLEADGTNRYRAIFSYENTRLIFTNGIMKPFQEGLYIQIILTDGVVTTLYEDTSSWSNAVLYDNNKKSSTVLAIDNTTEFTPTDDYNPVTKKYVDDSIASNIPSPYDWAKTRVIHKSSYNSAESLAVYQEIYDEIQSTGKLIPCIFINGMTNTAPRIYRLVYYGSKKLYFTYIQAASSGSSRYEYASSIITLTISSAGKVTRASITNNSGYLASAYSASSIYPGALTSDNVQAYLPSKEFHPVVKRYVDEAVKYDFNSNNINCWAASTQYAVGDLVFYTDTTYSSPKGYFRCNTSHKSSGMFSSDKNKWTALTEEELEAIERPTKKYVDDAITTAVGNITSFSLMPVEVLPTENIQTNVIYLLPSENPEEENVRVEYVYINGAWEKIGTTEIDLTNYYTKNDIDEKIEEAEKWLAGKRFYFADSMDSIDNIQALVVEAKETGWENIVLVVCGGFIEELHGLYTVTNTTLTTTEEGKNSGDVTFTMLHPGKRSFNIEYATFNDTGYNETTASEQTIVLTIQNDMLTGMDYPTTNEKLIARYLPTHANSDTPAYMPTVAANPASKGYVDSLNPIIFLDGTTKTTLAVDIREKIFPMLKDETVVRYPMFYVYPNDSEFNIGVTKIESVADDHLVLKSIDENMRVERTASSSWIIPSVDYLWIDHDYVNVQDIRKQTNQNGAPALVLETGAQYTEPYEPQFDGSPATKKYVDDKTNTLCFEGTSDEWNALTATEQDSFLVSLVEPMAETTEDIEETLQAIFLDETPTETEDDLAEDEANIQLDRIIEGGTI